MGKIFKILGVLTFVSLLLLMGVGTIETTDSEEGTTYESLIRGVSFVSADKNPPCPPAEPGHPDPCH